MPHEPGHPDPFAEVGGGSTVDDGAVDNQERQAQDSPPTAVEQAMLNAEAVRQVLGQDEQELAPDFASVVVGYNEMGTPNRVGPEQFIRSIWSMNTRQLHELANKMYIAGFINNANELDIQHANNRPTPELLAGATRMFKWLASGPARKVEYWENVLDDYVDGLTEAGLGGAGGSGGGSGTLSDPSAVRRTLEATYTQMVGKAPSEEEKRAFVTAIHKMQRDMYAQIYSARGDGGTTAGVGVDVGAQAMDFAEAERPVETQAKSIASNADLVRRLVMGGS